MDPSQGLFVGTAGQHTRGDELNGSRVDPLIAGRGSRGVDCSMYGVLHTKKGVSRSVCMMCAPRVRLMGPVLKSQPHAADGVFLPSFPATHQPSPAWRTFPIESEESLSRLPSRPHSSTLISSHIEDRPVFTPQSLSDAQIAGA